jgi:hypothetical protein
MHVNKLYTVKTDIVTHCIQWLPVLCDPVRVCSTISAIKLHCIKRLTSDRDLSWKVHITVFRDYVMKDNFVLNFRLVKKNVRNKENCTCAILFWHYLNSFIGTLFNNPINYHIFNYIVHVYNFNTTLTFTVITINECLNTTYIFSISIIDFFG